MHIEIQVALNFVISYLYNKLPRRRVNLFGEELEKALKDRFQGHWYPEKPFKGSAFRCLKTGDPIDAVLDRAARESGVPISDILENLPAELAVWVDPGEVSYRIGEKGAVKILHSESNDHHDDSSDDREVTKTFNPEAQCFRPIDAVSNSLNGLNISPKSSPQGSPPTSAPSPTFKATTSPAPVSSFLPRSQAPLTFTTATFAQTKFGSTKLKTSSKRSNSRMSPTEFSNYIKQRAMQQQLHHSHNHATNHLGPIGAASPSRSLSPNPLAMNAVQDPYFFQQNGTMGMYPPFNNGPRNLFDTAAHFSPSPHQTPAGGDGGMYGAPSNGPNKFAPYLDQHSFYGMGPSQQHQQQHPQPQQQQQPNGPNGSAISPSTVGQAIANGASAAAAAAAAAAASVGGSPGSNTDTSKLIDGLNSFYSNSGPYQHLLVAN